MANEEMTQEELSPNMQLIVSYLTDSLMLSTPLIENDPAYLQLKDSIPSIINMSLVSLGKDDVEELNKHEILLVVLKSLHTIYLRLAMSTAPEFDVSAEQVSFKKGDRFFHYTELAKNVAEQLDKEENSAVEVLDVRVSTKNGSIRNYNLAVDQKIGLKVNTVTDHSIELEWKMFNLTYGEFNNYTLMYSEIPIYDEYAIPRVREGNDIIKLDFFDIRRTKLRLMDLEAGKKYYILLIFRNRDGHKTYEQIEVETLSGEVVENGD